VPNLRPFFRAIQWPVDQVLNGLDAFLIAVPFWIFVVVAVALAWRTAGRGVAIFTFVSLILIDLMDVWPETMTTST